MNIYYIDYENVSSQGLKGVELLTENDEVVLLYSKKADNVKIDILTMMMESRAKIRFLPVNVGTPNALDFQLVTLLFLNYKPENFCYIISKDSGYDCCIKTAAQNGAANVARYPNIESAVNKTPAKKKAKAKTQSANGQDSVLIRPSLAEAAPASEEASSSGSTASADPAGDSTAAASEEAAKKKTSRRRSRKKAAPSDAEISPASSLQSKPVKEPVTEKTPEKESAKDASKTPEQVSAKIAPKTPEKEAQDSAPKTLEKEHQKGVEKTQEVLQQRYLSKQFDSKMPALSASGGRTDADKPVSILSVIRRRNDVQLDMHQIDLIREALKNSGNKQQFYSYFVKKLGQKQGIELYHDVKSSYTDLVNANLQ